MITRIINYMFTPHAKRGYFDTQIGLNNAMRDELIDIVTLYRVLGERITEKEAF